MKGARNSTCLRALQAHTNHVMETVSATRSSPSSQNHKRAASSLKRVATTAFLTTTMPRRRSKKKQLKTRLLLLPIIAGESSSMQPLTPRHCLQAMQCRTIKTTAVRSRKLPPKRIPRSLRYLMRMVKALRMPSQTFLRSLLSQTRKKISTYALP